MAFTEVNKQDTMFSESRHVDDVEMVNNEDQKPFTWNRTVITNLVALYVTKFAAAWALLVPGYSVTLLNRLWPEDRGISNWVATSATLATAVLSLFIGSFSDILGRRWFMVMANLAGLVGSLIASRATSTAMVIGGNSINGIGVAFALLVFPALAEMVPKDQRGPVVSIAAAMGGLIAITGGLVNGILMRDHVTGFNQGWRPGFYINAAWWFTGLVLVVLFYHPGQFQMPEGFTKTRLLMTVDWLGLLLGGTGLILTLLGLEFGGKVEPWTSATTLSLLLVGIVSLTIFAVREWWFPDRGFFQRKMFQHRNYALVLGINFMEGLSIFTANTFMIQMFATLINPDLFKATLAQLPYAMAALTGSAVVAVVMHKTKEAYWLVTITVAILTVSQAMLSFMQPGINYAAFAFPTIGIGFAIAVLGATVPTIATLGTPDADIGHVVSLATSVRALGGAIGLVMFSQVLNQKLNERLVPYFSVAVTQAGLPPSSIGPLLRAMQSGDQAQMAQVPGFTAQILRIGGRAVSQAYADSFRWVWYANIPFGVVTFAMSLFLRKTKPLMSKVVTNAVKQKEDQKEVKREKPDELQQ